MTITKPTIFDGEPYIMIDENGADFEFRGGQPVMDSGLENAATISLFTRENWWGNDVLPEENQVGARVEATAEQPITSTSLAEVEQETEKALAWFVDTGLAATVDAEATNPTSRATQVRVIITPSFGTATELLVLRNGVNWINQKVDPANRK